MNNSRAEFDRSHRKTTHSRSISFTHSREKGFTLIELMVVISIIALLSTIVLGAVSDSRAKARNTAKNSLVLEYVKALELHRSNTGSYPSVSTPTCVGYGSTETCYGTINGSDTLRSSLTTYLSGDFASRQSIVISNLDMKGVIYSCSDSACSSYSLQWILEKRINQCINNSTSIAFPPPSGDNTRCSYAIN